MFLSQRRSYRSFKTLGASVIYSPKSTLPLWLNISNALLYFQVLLKAVKLKWFY